jgi:rhamnogalacturonan endolyase
VVDWPRLGSWLSYPREFPKGVDYTIGKSDPSKDLNWAQFAGTTWAIHFQLGFVPDQGAAFLRVALAGRSDGANLQVLVNKQDVTGAARRLDRGAMHRAGVVMDDIARLETSGYYSNYLFAIDTSTFRLGENIVELKVSGGSPTDGVAYDALRLEFRPDSAKLFSPETPVTFVPDMGYPSDGIDFGQSYKGDPSGNYTGLTHMKRNH